jgi:pimeloyl-ACP methyl ester carboxylesterase
MWSTRIAALLALAVAGPRLWAQECPPDGTPPIRPSLGRGAMELAGVYRAPFEYVCGGPLTLRVRKSGTELTATVQAEDGCAQNGQVRWRGSVAGGGTAFAVTVPRPGGSMAGTATLLDPCTIAVTVAGRAGSARYTRTDGACADDGGRRPLVVFVGGALDEWNRNLLKVFCAYDARWERTRKLYVMHTEDAADVRRRVLREAAGAPVALIGHSYGGNYAYELANAMHGDGGVALLVTLDPVSGPAGPRIPLEPGTAGRWIHVWAGSGIGLSSCGLAGALGGAWGSQPRADADLRFPPDPSDDDPSMDHCKTEQMIRLAPIQDALAELATRAVDRRPRP